MDDLDPVDVMAHWPDDSLPYRLAWHLQRAHEELRQGWPKLARDANAAAVEAMNERDRLAAELAAERAKVQRLIDTFTYEDKGSRWTAYRDMEPADDIVAAALNGVS